MVIVPAYHDRIDPKQKINYAAIPFVHSLIYLLK